MPSEAVFWKAKAAVRQMLRHTHHGDTTPESHASLLKAAHELRIVLKEAGVYEADFPNGPDDLYFGEPVWVVNP